MLHSDPPRNGPRSAIQSDNTGLVSTLAIAALAILAVLVFWPRIESTNTAMRDEFPHVERVPTTVSPESPTKPVQ